MTKEKDSAVLCRIRRISDERYRALKAEAFPIFEQWPAFSRFQYDQTIDESPLSLAEYYAFMRIRFGDSGRVHDDWKGIFSFPFELEFLNSGICHRYVVNVVNWRSTVELRFAKVIENKQGLDRSIYRRAVSEEFSEEQMEYLDAYLYGFVAANRKVMRYCDIPDFVRKIEMESVILGHRDGRFFERRYEDNKKFWEDTLADAGLTSAAISEEKWPEADALDSIDIKVPESFNARQETCLVRTQVRRNASRR